MKSKSSNPTATISLNWKQIPNPHFKFYGPLYPSPGGKILNLKILIDHYISKLEEIFEFLNSMDHQVPKIKSNSKISNLMTNTSLN